MKFRIGRYSIDVIPETDEDTAYIEDTLGLRNHGDFVPLVRRNAMGLTCIAGLYTEKDYRPEPKPLPANAGRGDIKFIPASTEDCESARS